MDWDWPLIIEIAILVVAITGTTLIWAERTERRRGLGLPVMPHPQWRAVDVGSGSTLRIEAANSGAAASHCCVVMQAGTSLYAGTFSLAELQPWSAQTLERFDVLDHSADPQSLLCVARNPDGIWSMRAPNKYVDAISEQTVRFHIIDVLKRATGRKYACAVSSEGVVIITPAASSLAASPRTAV
ncbi:MAG: hypothetical protein WAL84_12215 [Candidatus Dormiibacterota bacterium]